MRTPEIRAYDDGSEARVLDIVRQAHDIGSMSDELALAGLGWPDRYHLAHSRANVARAFDLAGDVRVLEVGAGCGAITRWLGERCALVDALEPELHRARVARTRTRDLDSVEVIVGRLDDVPPEPVYDAVLVIGVLEYVGGGSSSDEPYRTFLRRVRDVLRPGGSAIIAIENRLGVKYIAGAPEDHTGNVYEGVEGYGRRAHALTFSRRELRRLVSEAGLTPTVLSAFPDYKFSRALLHESLFAVHPPLAWRLPAYATGGMAAGDEGVDERLLWRQMVEAGVAADFANSFIVLAHNGEPSRPLWPEQRLATVFQPGRRARYTVQTNITQEVGCTRFERTALHPAADEGPLHHHPRSEDMIEGIDLIEVLEQQAGSLDDSLLQRWRALLSDDLTAAPSLDLIPANLVLTTDGSLRQIDDEWTHDRYGPRDVLARGALVTALHLAATTHPSRWTEPTVRALAVRIGNALMPDNHERWLDATVEREAELQGAVFLPPPGLPGGMSAADAHRSRLNEWLSRSMESMPLGERAGRRAAGTERDLSALTAERDLLRAQLQSMASSRSWRVTAPLRATSKQLRRR